MIFRAVAPAVVRRAVIEAVETRRLFAAPALDAIAAASVPVGKTIQIPVTSTSSAGTVTYTVRDESNKVAGTYRPAGNTFIQMNVTGYSQPMVFELFNDTSPNTVQKIVGLINSRFYDGLTFHRIINNFVIQGGDPKGDGTGGPQFTFDDEFDVNTTLTGTGQLAMANSGKDTNGSQFFITEGPQRLLDFNHTVLGQLVRGEATRQAISNVATNATSGKPNTSVVISSVRVIRDRTDAVLEVSAKAAGTYSIKVTATNADGSTARRFNVTAAADTINDPPILQTNRLQSVYYTTPGKAVTLNLTSLDPEGDAGVFGAQFVNQNGASGAYAGANNKSITITPGTATGPITLLVGVVSSATASSRGSTAVDTNNPLNIYDTQMVTIAVGDLPISVAANDFDAPAGTATGSFLVGSIRDSDAGGSAANFSAQIDWGDGTVTAGSVRKSSRTGRYGIYASKTYGSKVNAQLPVKITVTGDKGALASDTSVATVRTVTSLSGGVLTINGTSGDDRIGISRKGHTYNVTVNRQTTSFATTAVTSFQAYGFTGDDLIQFAPTVTAGTYIEGDAGNDALYGGSGADTINGGDGNDTLVTGDGTNRVAGGDGDDSIVGGANGDRISGGKGRDSIDGGGSRDILNGDEDNDVVVGGAGNDQLYGGDGSDVFNGGRGADNIDGGGGRDTARRDDTDTRISVEVLV